MPLTRRRMALLAGVVLLLLVAAAAWIGLRGLAAQRHLEAARDALEVARAAATDRRLPEARAAIAEAGADTERARSLTSDPVWWLVGAVPYAGATVATASGLADAADELARRVLPAALDGIEQADPDELRGPDGAVDLELLATVTPAIVQGAEDVVTVQSDLADLPRRGVVGPVAEARDELVAEVADLAGTLTGASTAVRLAPALLGEDRPRRYVVLVQQNAESRGTGGLPGGYAVVEADAGRLRILETGSSADAPDGTVEVPDGLTSGFRLRYGPLGAFDLWVNANVSPDLPAVSRVIVQRWREQRQTAVDGVVALDAQALAAILQGSEPVRLADGRLLPNDQLVEYLAVGQYEEFVTVPGQNLNARSEERKEALGVVAGQTAARLAGGGGSGEALLRGLVDAVRSGHLRMASDDPALALLSEAGVDGALPSPQRPVAYPVVFNSTGGKLEHFLDRSVRYEADGCRDGVRRSRISVTLTNRAPAQGLPPYVTTRQTRQGEVVSSTDSAVTLQVYATAGSRLVAATLDGERLGPEATGLPVLTRFREGGLPVWALLVELPREQARTLVLELEEPALAGEVQMPEQPLARPMESTTTAEPCS